MNSPVIVQKLLLASSSSRVESSWNGVGECNSFDFSWRISCYFPPDDIWLSWRMSCSSLRSGRSQVKVDVLRRCSLPKILTAPSATESVQFPLLCGVNTSFALPRNILGKTAPKWCSPDWSFAEIGWSSTVAPKRYYWSVKWHSEPPFIRCLPTHQTRDLECFADSNSIPPFVTQTWLQQYSRCPFLYSAHTWNQFLVRLAKFQRIVSVNDFPRRLQELHQILQRHQNVPLGHDCTNASSARRPCYFRL